ncbi:MAG: methylcrotonyl-CoA carboxylase subunit alpha [Lysobacterales bacterium]|nr:MAG: methylcrotonyl-CoA carboxylase subunit alpha [Xanthomonadales bacterium]
MFKSILIANRGEIACRIARTCRRLGIEAIAVYSDADRGARHVREADRAIGIGGERPADSYLRIDKLIAAAKETGAQAIHPGYGFLSENPRFARAVREAGLVFIGPDPESMEAMGSKAAAKALMIAHGVPVVPGYHGEAQDIERLAAEAERIGFPLMIKAAAGGGGKGMRIVRETSGLEEAIAAARREAESAFGDGRLILERYLEKPRHIEFQVFGDRHGRVIHLGERDCSAQRRYQKIVEETPSPALDEALRARMGEAAVAAARAVHYVGAGTVEFILAADREFYFMEMNTRLQVEHPVTELVRGLDLVEWQIRIAAGEALPAEPPPARGHAIEVRLYAEDPAKGFLPASGRIETLRLAEGLRIDSGVEAGDRVSIFYDPMIAKLIAHGGTREEALARLREGLARSLVRGPASNLDFLLALLDHPAMCEGRVDTGFVDRELPALLAPLSDNPPPWLWQAAATAALLKEEEGVDPADPWARTDAWRPNHVGKRLVKLRCGEWLGLFEAFGHGGRYRLASADPALCAEIAEAAFLPEDRLLLRFADGRALSLLCLREGEDLWLWAGGYRRRFHRDQPFAAKVEEGGGEGHLRAPMPGRIVALRVSSGSEVEKDQPLVVMEAMKMELTLRAPGRAHVLRIAVAEGDFVEADALLVELERRP